MHIICLPWSTDTKYMYSDFGYLLLYTTQEKVKEKKYLCMLLAAAVIDIIKPWTHQHWNALSLSFFLLNDLISPFCMHLWLSRFSPHLIIYSLDLTRCFEILTDWLATQTARPAYLSSQLNNDETADADVWKKEVKRLLLL